MAYKIEYGEVAELLKPKTKLRQFVIVFLILALVVAAAVIKSVGLPFVREVLLPGDPAVTAMALDALAENIRDGIPIFEALETFCKEIVNGAYAS